MFNVRNVFLTPLYLTFFLLTQCKIRITNQIKLHLGPEWHIFSVLIYFSEDTDDVISYFDMVENGKQVLGYIT